MKYLFLLSLVVFVHPQAKACTPETIRTIVGQIRTYEDRSVGNQLTAVLDNLALCDENLDLAGRLIGQSFTPYQEYATAVMSQIIQSRANLLPSELVRGLGFGLISEIAMYQHNPTINMLNAILSLARARPEYARLFALELLKKQAPYQAETNNQLLAAVGYLREMTVATPPSGGSSIWAFRSQSESCEDVTGPWGRYELCPRYFASVSDAYGNRVVLACKSGNAGIEFRLALGSDLWRQAQSVRIQTLAFGTGSSMQSLGVPYVISRDRALLAEEVLAPEILQQLRSASKLKIAIRANSGESQLSLNFTLAGSGKAIGALLNVCR